ncbi:dTMP kinase [Kitasatospora sp. NPDC059088]|uniref:dTMP kinase n=1 Tax=Kitasatospora sp. NPDC059088 TaxID=3346722 RepID=UPI0036BEB673
MADQPGLFTVLEGTDGSGKSAITEQLVAALRAAGHTVRRLDRARPTGETAHAALVRAVNELFRSPTATAAGWEHLSLAAAAQYHSILHAQVVPAVAAGEIVIADSWWDKTWVRLGLEAEIVQHLDEHRRRALQEWQQALLPPSPLPVHQRLTVLIDTPMRDRIAWYQAAGCPDAVLGRTGVLTRETEEYGEFTERIATGLRELAARHRWPVVANGTHRTAAQAATDLCALIEQRTRSAVHAPEPV